MYSNRYCNAVPACLRQHAPALIIVADAVTASTASSAVPASRHVLDRPVGLELVRVRRAVPVIAENRKV